MVVVGLFVDPALSKQHAAGQGQAVKGFILLLVFCTGKKTHLKILNGVQWTSQALVQASAHNFYYNFVKVMSAMRC